MTWLERGLRVAALAASLLGGAGCASGVREGVLGAAAAAAVEREVQEAEARMVELNERGGYQGYREYLSERYVYIDVSGGRVTKAGMLARREGDKREPVETVESEQETVVLSERAVLVRGHEATMARYYGALPRKGDTRYSSLWVKEEDGRWRVLADQATPTIRREYPVKLRAEVPAAALEACSGDYELEVPGGVRLVIRASGGELMVSIPGQLEGMAFLPEGERAFFATARPWELRFDEDHKGLTIVTWGSETRGRRIGG